MRKLIFIKTNSVYRSNQNSLTAKVIFLLFFILAIFSVKSQTKSEFIAPSKNAFLAGQSFIENVGQYGKAFKGGENLGAILYGFEGHDMPILFTKKGIIILQRKVVVLEQEQKEKLERQGKSEEEIEHKKTVTDRSIKMEWVGANNNVEVITEEKTYDYHTYGMLEAKAYGFKKITFKNLYIGIDLVYSFTNNTKIGFEYSLHIAPGADISQIKMQYSGDVKKITTNSKGELTIGSDVEGVKQSTPITFYSESQKDRGEKNSPQSNEISTVYNIQNNLITFECKPGYDHSKAIIIDPFVSSTNNLDGANAGKAKDIDFDYAGDVYVTGGGGSGFFSNHRLAKYNASGILQWTFNGTLSNPMWVFGPFLGGWVVEKLNGKIYLGQGFDDDGFRIIRLNENGIYDNFISTADDDFQENWKMIWNCNNGNPEILIAGGGPSSNINLGRISPPSSQINSINLTGLSTSGQDIADVIIDPLNNDMFTIYSTLFNGPSPILLNKIYKNGTPYSGSSVVWNTPSSFLTMSELKNRPYLQPDVNGLTDNSANIFALNATYLFYWDGKNLKAFNKATGAGVGTPLITTNTAKMTGGIYADACNNVYVGSVNGTIKVYNFNGLTFDDAPADLTITGFTTKSVYDIAFNDAEKLLYASGDGFVASFNLAGVCGNPPSGPNTYVLNITTDCVTTVATATVTPTVPTGSVITYALYLGTTLISTNNSGVFTGLLSQSNYKIIATINQACSGIQLAGNFNIPVSPAPTVNSPTVTYCQGAAALPLTATGSNLLWYTAAVGGTGSSAAPVPSTSTTGNTSYYVSQTVTGNCESPRTQITVQITAIPSAPIVTSNISYCQNGTSTTLTATGTNLLWYQTVTGGVGSITAPMPTTSVIGTTNYYVSQTNNNGCESPRAAINVLITAPLFANAGNNVTIPLGGSTQLNAQATGGADYTWSSTITPIALSNIKILNPVANPLQTMTYILTVKEIVGSCPPVTSSVQVSVVQNCINIRNSFTPNGDGINDRWLVYDQDFCLAKDGATVQVFNRYGTKVYENKAYKNNWEGTYNGKPLPDGTYYAVVNFTLFDGRKQTERKDVTILR